MTQDANPGPEDCDPPDEGEGQQSRRDGPGPEDDDPPPQKRPQASSFFGLLRYMFARFFHRP